MDAKFKWHKVIQILKAQSTNNSINHEHTWQVNYCNIYNLHWKDKLCSLDLVLCTLPASCNQSTTARVEKYSLQNINITHLEYMRTFPKVIIRQCSSYLFLYR